eukprot:7678401-Pyramimonas_sp.AAC.1
MRAASNMYIPLVQAPSRLDGEALRVRSVDDVLRAGGVVGVAEHSWRDGLTSWWRESLDADRGGDNGMVAEAPVTGWQGRAARGQPR